MRDLFKKKSPKLNACGIFLLRLKKAMHSGTFRKEGA